MRSSTRHQLKQDAFAEKTAESISWAVENRSKLIAASIAAVAAIVIVVGGWTYISFRNRQASQEIAAAITKYNAPVLPPGTPAPADTLSFSSEQERAKAANGDFTRIANKYSITETGHLARYFEGLTLRQMGDNAGAEKQLKEVANGHYEEIASLAKFALASLYHETGRDPQAIALYKELMEHPTMSVSKSAAQLQLADLYRVSQPQEARKIYEQIQKETPASPAAQQAAQGLQELSKQ